jgi:glucan-binding YG repeat protein
MVEGDGGTELYKLKNKIYGVRTDGSLVTGGFATINGKKYYFNKTGQMVKNCTFKLSGKKYKASKSGVVTMVKSK